MKMLVVSNMYPDDAHPSYGIFVKKFCDELDAAAVEYDLSVMRKADSKPDKLLGYLKFYLLTVLKLLLRKYDVIYVHYASHSSPPVLLASRIKKLTVYTNLHGSDAAPVNRSQKAMQGYTQRLLQISSRIIVPSEYFKSLVAGKYAPLKCPIVVYPSAGVNKSVFRRRSEDEILAFKRKHHLREDAVIFGMASRIISGKGWETFIDAVSEFEGSGADAEFVIVGDGPQAESMRAYMKEKRLSDKIKLIGLLPQEELAIYFSALDYFVFPTQLQESLGLTALEAMACRTPVIASAFAAPNDYVEDGVNGYKFQVSDAGALRQIMEKCFSMNMEAYNQLQENAYRTAERFFAENIRKGFNEVIAYGD